MSIMLLSAFNNIMQHQQGGEILCKLDSDGEEDIRVFSPKSEPETGPGENTVPVVSQLHNPAQIYTTPDLV